MRFCQQQLCLLVAALVLISAVNSRASQLGEALEAGEGSVSYLEGALTGMYQRSLEAD